MGRSLDKNGFLAIFTSPLEGSCVTCPCPGLVRGICCNYRGGRDNRDSGYFDVMGSGTLMCARVHMRVLSELRAMG